MINPELKGLLLESVRENSQVLIREWTDYFRDEDKDAQHRYYADFLAFFEECVEDGLERGSGSANALINYLVKLSEVVGEDLFYNFRDSVYTCFLKFPILHDLDRKGGFNFENAKAMTQFFESLTSNIVLSYIDERRRREGAAQAELEEREAPMGEIWDGVLMVSIVGSIDSHRVLTIIDKVLARLDNSGVRHVIVDIGSISGINSEVTSQLLKLNNAIHFMGARGYLTGITPLIAKSLTHLDIHLGDLRTYASSKDALKDIVSEQG